jgi:bifunctional non-homologous end joining protein LigD
MLLEGSALALVYCDHVEGHGETIVEHAKKLGAAGIVSKRADSKYAARAAKDWVVVRFETGEVKPKVRKSTRQEEVEVLVSGIKLTHPGRILYPEERVTKRMLAEYYQAVAPVMLRHVAKRPLSIYRCPGGIEKEGFFQKQLGEVSSRHLRSTQSGDDPYVALDDVRGLITLAQWNVLEIHAWGCREEAIEGPDLMIFDLDPGPNVPWEQIVEGAKGLRLLLGELGLESFVKTSGGKGLHVAVPLSGGQDWHEIKDFAARAARKIVEVAPKHFTVFMSKPERRGKVFIDYHRNHRGSTCVAAYSTRARPGAFVSTPLDWPELDGPQPRLHIYQVLERIKSMGDPWEGLYEVKQSLSPEALSWLRG